MHSIDAGVRIFHDTLGWSLHVVRLLYERPLSGDWAATWIWKRSQPEFEKHCLSHPTPPTFPSTACSSTALQEFSHLASISHILEFRKRPADNSHSDLLVLYPTWHLPSGVRHSIRVLCPPCSSCRWVASHCVHTTLIGSSVVQMTKKKRARLLPPRLSSLVAASSRTKKKKMYVLHLPAPTIKREY